MTWTNPDSAQLIADSTTYDCNGGGPPIHQLETIEIWQVPITGGAARLAATVPAVGREGLTESWTTAEAGHYYVVARNTAGPSCASTTIYFGPVTGVALPSSPPEPAPTVRYYDVFGRRVNRPTRSGIYWKVVKGRKPVKIVYLK